MKKERLTAAIHELEELEREQQDDIEETRKALSVLRRLAGSGNGAIHHQLSPIRPTAQASTQTYSQIAVKLLKEAGSPMHINKIVEGICLEKNVPIGSIARPSVQTTLMRFMKRSKEIRKAGPAKFKYNENTP